MRSDNPLLKYGIPLKGIDVRMRNHSWIWLHVIEPLQEFNYKSLKETCDGGLHAVLGR